VDKKFKPQEVEKKIYEKWERSGAFTPKVDLKRKPFVIMMPPPNVTGSLHIGHALFLSLQDIMVRYHRMKGDPTLYLPGKDHAAIGAQNVVERELWKNEKKTRHDLGKKEFLKRMWIWMDKYGEVIESQIRRMGASCDWSRKRFTMDEEYRAAVKEAFERLRKKGLIYRGERMVNWCPRCGTTLSDIEVEHEERSGSLWYIKYPLANSRPADPSTSAGKTIQAGKLKSGGSRSAEVSPVKYIVVATTRPETMLGDTAVAVNPKDERYKGLVGRTAILPLMDRKIPIIADETVDLKFGTGAVKITPAHDPRDYGIGQRHKLPTVTVVGFDDKITEEGGKYAGLEKLEARRRIVQDLKEKGLLEKEEVHRHAVGVCYRCKSVVEPLLSEQWFVRATSLARPAIEAVRKGKIKIVPKRFTKVYLHWMENIRDWCISRQIWWGHPVPVEGSDDTLDTWFSSAIWPFATLGWPHSANATGASELRQRSASQGNPSDLEYFYPTTVLETGWDILFFWVARMVMMGIELTGDVPFNTVVLHGMVKDKTGKKMSKSRPEHNIDPLEVIEKYGSDALRMSLVVGATLGQDMTLSENKIVGYRNFANKVWNIGRFVCLTSSERLAASSRKMEGRAVHRIPKAVSLKSEDKEILEELNQLVKKITKDLDNYRFSQAGEAIYQFMWHRLADVYIEEIKNRLREGDQAAQETLLTTVKTCLKLLHPFMPFVTEAVWGNLEEKKLLITSPWPKMG